MLSRRGGRSLELSNCIGDGNPLEVEKAAQVINDTKMRVMKWLLKDTEKRLDMLETVTFNVGTLFALEPLVNKVHGSCKIGAHEHI